MDARRLDFSRLVPVMRKRENALAAVGATAGGIVLLGALVAGDPGGPAAEFAGAAPRHPFVWVVLVLLLLGGCLQTAALHRRPYAAQAVHVAVAATALELVAVAVGALWPDASATVLQGTAWARYVLLLPLLGLAVVGSATTLVRLAGHRRRTGRPGTAPSAPSAPSSMSGPSAPSARPVPPAAAAAAPAEHGRTAYWARNTVLPGMRPDGTWPEPDRGDEGAAFTSFGGRGVCVSGGGIRSAAFTLGTVHALRDSGELARTDVLAAVSGGGYLAGAMQLALQDDPAHPGTVRDPREVFAEGSPETDHLRRHGRYLADGAAQWGVALLVIARGVLVTVALLGLLAVVAGRWVGHGLRMLAGGGVLTWSPADLPPGVVAALLAVAVLAGLFWTAGNVARTLGSATTRPGDGPAGEDALAVLDWLTKAAKALGWLALLVAGFSVLVPGLVALSLWLARHPGSGTGWLATGWRQALGGGALLTVVTYAGTLISIGRRARAATSASRSSGTSGTGLVTRAGRGLRAAGLLATVQRFLVGAAVAVVGSLYLVLLGSVAAGVVGATGQTAAVVETLLLTAVLALVYFALDQTGLGLHPFYRRRLATAFAVRRRQVGEGSAARFEARPYSWDEVTSLHRYGRRVPGFPKVVHCASAHVSGQDTAPPGRRVVSFTLDGDWVGSPQLGWYRADPARRGFTTPFALELDLTVESATAVAGGAFASAMGRHATPFNVLLALSNARLGTWLPNPRYATELAGHDRDWWRAHLPDRRPLTYLLREIFSRYPVDDPLVYVTDGGHYENLGLVELLRRRCTSILCVDASGDGAQPGAAVADAISLAREELGVTVDLPVAGLLPGSATAPGDPLAGRMAASAVAVGTVRYPPLPRRRLSAATGRIVYVKAVLSPGVPWDVRAYAARNERFPDESTGDQWFDFDQFDAYHQLGRAAGSQACEVLGLVEALAPEEIPVP